MTSDADAAAITRLLQAAQQGDRGALDALFPLVYEQLSVLAHRQRQAWVGDISLNTTAVVHEAYLKLTDQKRLPAESRAHFFAVAARAMRHILCNYARDRRRLKRGGGAQHVDVESVADPVGELSFSDEQTETLAALDDALRRLEAVADRQGRVVECRFFGGMTVEDTAAALGVSVRTVKRDWSFARAWLQRELELYVPES